ncbi:TPA: hypothetical protein ACH3X1_008084 [Trebouxia sp. C0004]
MANSIGLALWRLLVRLLSLSEHKSVFPMLSVAKSADHLGLTSLCNFAAEARVQRPWEHRLSDLMGSPPSHSMSNNESSAAELSAVTQPSTAVEQYTQCFPSVMLLADGQDKTLDLDLSDVHKMKLLIQRSNIPEADVLAMESILGHPPMQE